jgi:hypothetical protein
MVGAPYLFVLFFFSQVNNLIYKTILKHRIKFYIYIVSKYFLNKKSTPYNTKVKIVYKVILFFYLKKKSDVR